MNTKIRRAAYSLFGISILLTLVLAYPEVNRSRAKAPDVARASELATVTTDTVEETVTLSPANLKSWEHYYDWAHEKSHCGPHPEDIAGSIVAGIKQSEGCPSGSHTVYRGTVWFDLSTIMSKAPPLHVSIRSAKLHFNQSGECPGELLYGTADWLKGYSDNELVPGDPHALAKLPSGIRTGTLLGGLLAKPCAACSIEVGTVVNNWLRGEEHGGYTNYGFVFKGMLEADVFYGGNPSCVSRYGDFSLTVTYKYDKEPVIMVVLPKPDTPVAKPGVSSPLGESTALARTNFALASNGGKATASSASPGYSPSGTIDGDRKGLNFGKDGYWSSETGTFPQWLEVDFSGSKTITEIDLFTIQDNYASPSDPVSGMAFAKYGLTDFNVQFWNESLGSWQPIPGGGVKGNKLVWNQFSFPGSPITTSRIRVECLGSADLFSRIAELEAWSK
jgi:hypothetical protein